MLRRFVAEELRLQGKWSSPEDNAKMFNSELVTLTWYPNKGSLPLRGVYGERLRVMLLSAVTDYNRGNITSSAPVNTSSSSLGKLGQFEIVHEVSIEEGSFSSTQNVYPTNKIGDKPSDRQGGSSLINISSPESCELIHQSTLLNATHASNLFVPIPTENSSQINLETTLRATLNKTDSALQDTEKLRTDWLSLKTNLMTLLDNHKAPITSHLS